MAASSWKQMRIGREHFNIGTVDLHLYGRLNYINGKYVAVSVQVAINMQDCCNNKDRRV